ncbi:MAG TPA: hypothetical protein PLN21_21060 [Gemmatales bacterium]|nr:hypothetical protein [Gemmatales bacterium]
MSISSKARAERQAKERKRWKKRQEARYSHFPVSRLDDFDDIEDEIVLLGALPGGVPGEEIEINHGPMPDPTFETLSKHWRKRLAFVKTTKPEGMVPYLDVLAEAVEADLPLPLLWNHLGNAYLLSGRIDKAGMIFEETIRRFPEYFYGRPTYAHWLLRHGRAADALEVMGGDFNLPRLLHGRKVIHFQEACGFHLLRAEYYLTVNDLTAAAESMDIMELISPLHPAINDLRDQMQAALTKKMGWFGRW